MRLSYYAISVAIRDILVAEISDIPSLMVDIERDVLFPVESPSVIIYADKRSAPASKQRLSAGTRTDFEIEYSIWCYGYSIENSARACEIRDDLISKVEIALMKNPTLNNTIAMSYLAGGDFSGKDMSSGFYRAGEVRLIANAPTRY